jgi:hypothetical protein
MNDLYSACLPSAFELKRSIADTFFKQSLFKSALDIYQDLDDKERLIESYISSGRKTEAEQVDTTPLPYRDMTIQDNEAQPITTNTTKHNQPRVNTPYARRVFLRANYNSNNTTNHNHLDKFSGYFGRHGEEW